MATAATLPSFAQRASQQLLITLAGIEKLDKPNSLVQELANRIIEQNLMPADIEIRFASGKELIEVRFSKEGDLLKYSRNGGNSVIDYDRLPAQSENSNSPLAKYNWTSLAHSDSPAEITLTAYKTTAYVVAGSLVGTTNLGIALGAAYALNKYTQAKIPVTLHTVMGTGAVIAATSALFGNLGVAIGLSAAAWFTMKSEEYALFQTAETVFEGISPQIKKIGTALMEKAGIAILNA